MSSWLEGTPLWVSMIVFAAAAAVILVAGSRLERRAEQIGRVTKLGDVFAGMILLAVSTSLPELATCLTAALRGEAGMAVNNLLGSVVLQTMVLALADLVGGPGALTGRVPSFGLLIQGVGLVLVLATTAIAATAESHWRDVTWLAEAGPAGIVVVYLLMQFVTMRSGQQPGWSPSQDGAQGGATPATEPDDAAHGEPPRLRHLLLVYLGLSMLVCAGGYAVVLATQHIATSTGASQNFLGFTLVAFATSLPEVSTTILASRRRRGITAASNIFGSNSLCPALILLVAVVADGPTFPDQLIPSVFAATLGIVLTAIYLVGMLERRDRTVLRMGWDSGLVLVLGLLGIWVMFALGASA